MERVRRIEEFLRPTADCFIPFDKHVRYKGARGGRGGAKSHEFAGRLIETAWATKGLRSACIREVQKTLQHSSKALIEAKLAEAGLGPADGFKVFKECIVTPGDGICIFNGMQNHTAESIKSLEGFKIIWWEEAHGASATSLKILRPTIRADNAEMWFSWNPRFPPNPKAIESSVDGLFTLFPRKPIEGTPGAWTVALPGGGVLVECGYRDNPWFPPDLELERQHDQKHRTPEDYANIWDGAYETRSEARVFHNWKVCEYATPSGANFRFGGDFGFSVDPSVLIRCFIGRWVGEPGTPGAYVVADDSGRDLFIDYEAWRIGCDVDYTPALFAGACPFETRDVRHWKNPFGDAGIPGALDWPLVADSARPETINYLKRHGFARIEGAKKGAGSVEEGVEFLKAYTIWIHPRCPHVADEFLYYSFKVDARTGEILPVLQDAKNHTIDSCRYAVEKVRRARGFFG